MSAIPQLVSAPLNPIPIVSRTFQEEPPTARTQLTRPMRRKTV